MQQTVKQMMPAIGASVLVRFESLTVVCIVLDAKNSWGKVRLQIEPILGQGSQWVELERVTPIEDNTALISYSGRTPMETLRLIEGVI